MVYATKAAITLSGGTDVTDVKDQLIADTFSVLSRVTDTVTSGQEASVPALARLLTKRQSRSRLGQGLPERRFPVLLGDLV